MCGLTDTIPQLLCSRVLIGIDFLCAHFVFYKNHVYKNGDAQKCSFFKNIVVNLLVAISFSFEPQDKI